MTFNLEEYSFLYKPTKLINPYCMITLVYVYINSCTPIVTINILNSFSKLFLSRYSSPICARDLPIFMRIVLRSDFIFYWWYSYSPSTKSSCSVSYCYFFISYCRVYFFFYIPCGPFMSLSFFWSWIKASFNTLLMFSIFAVLSESSYKWLHSSSNTYLLNWLFSPN